MPKNKGKKEVKDNKDNNKDDKKNEDKELQEYLINVGYCCGC